MGRLAMLGAVVALTSGACGGHAPALAEPSAIDAPTSRAAAPSSSCTKDSDCKGQRVCQDGACAKAVDSAAVQSVGSGGVALTDLQNLRQSKKCVGAPGIGVAVDVASNEPSEQAITDLAHKFGADSSLSQSETFGEWLLLAHEYGNECKQAVKSARLAQAATNLNAVVSEQTIEGAAKRTDCAQMTAVNAIGLWPYEQRFSQEIVGRKFFEAEVTRKVWLNMLTTFSTECQKRLSQRERIGVNTQMDRLRGIIGLNDSMLIGMRSKLLVAMESGSAQTIATLSKAVSEREALLDSRSAASDLKTDLKKLEFRQRIAEKKLAQANAQTKTGQPANKAPGTQGPTVNDAVNAVNAGKNAVNLARGLFGF